MKKLICFFKEHDYTFYCTPGMVGIPGSRVVSHVDAAEWKCVCSRCGKTYSKVQSNFSRK